jgi:flagellar hook-associated protein 2
MSISSPGIGSGIDVNSLVSQLVAAERAPSENRFARVEESAQAQLSAFGALRSALSGLDASLKRFAGTGSTLGRKTTVAEGAGFTASATASAAPGRYQVTVASLATAQKVQSAPLASASQLGYGTLTITPGGGGDPIVVDIASGEGRLADIRDAINEAAEGQGVTATLVRGDAGDVLVLSSTVVGADGAFTIASSGGDGGLAALQTTGGTLVPVTPAADAEVEVDGVVRTASGNRLDDVIDGVVIDLTKAAPGTPFSLDVTADASPLKAQVLSLVSAYNAALSAIRTQTTYNAATQQASALTGDSAPRSIQAQLRNAISGAFGELSALGVKSSADGSLSLDGARFDAAIAADPLAVDRIFGDEGSLGVRLRDSLSSIVGDDGLIEGRTDALTARLKALTTQREAFDARMERVEAAYRRQFTALDGLVAQLSSTQSFLTQQLNALAAQTGNS